MRESLSTSPAQLGIGLIGTGFMGRAHALAFGNANAALDLPARIRLSALADADSARAEQCASAWGFDRSHADWQQLIDDPYVQIVAITTPITCTFPWPWPPLLQARPCIAKSRWP
ncbi:Gfo/Idh/MocA family oxidoreductase [Pseudomonas syringae]|nr:Gfo/Idh/MocA family oxidoreductase [Pseudomonas syringae]